MIMKGNIKWIAIFAAVVVLCAAVWIIRKGVSVNGDATAKIIRDGAVISEIRLGDVKEPYEFDIDAPGGGKNRIRVERGRICVIDADCPDRICVDQGYIDDPSAPIVCLPHKLTITIAGEGKEYDAVVGRDR